MLSTDEKIQKLAELTLDLYYNQGYPNPQLVEEVKAIARGEA